MLYYDFIGSLREKTSSKELMEFIQEFASNGSIQCEINRNRCYLYYRVIIDKRFSPQDLFHTINKTGVWPDHLKIYDRELIKVYDRHVTIPITFNKACPYFMDRPLVEPIYIQFPITFPIEHISIP